MMTYIKRSLLRIVEDYHRDRVLFLSALFIPMICVLFFYCSTTVLRTLFYVSLPCVVALFLQKKADVRRLIAHDKLMWGVAAAFVLFMCASVMWSETEHVSRYLDKGKLFIFIGITTLSTALITYKKPVFPEIIRWAYIAGAVSSALVLIGHYLVAHGISWPKERLEGMGRAGNPVQASLMYGLAVVAILCGKFPAYISETASIGRRYGVRMALVTPLVLVMMMTQSRGPFLAMCVTLAGFVFWKAQHKVKTMAIVGLCAVVVSVPAYIQLKDAEIFNRKTTGRFEVWEKASQKIWEHPIIGNGLASDSRYTYTNEGGSILTASHIHSVYLSTLFQGGVIGFVLFMMLYAVLVKRLQYYMSRYTPESFWIAGWVFMGAAFGIADFGGIVINLSTEWLVFWWPIGCVVGQLMLADQERLEKDIV